MSRVIIKATVSHACRLERTSRRNVCCVRGTVGRQGRGQVIGRSLLGRSKSDACSAVHKQALTLIVSSSHSDDMYGVASEFMLEKPKQEPGKNFVCSTTKKFNTNGPVDPPCATPHC